MTSFNFYLLESSELSKSDLTKIITYSEKLQNMISPGDKLEDWIKAKITHADNYIDTVLDYLRYNKVKNENRLILSSNKILFLLNESYNSEMTISNLKSIYEKSNILNSIIKNDTKLEDWVKAKLNLAGEYLDDVYHHLDHFKNESRIGKLMSIGTLFLSTLLPSSADSYVIQSGDSFSKIANKLNISVSEIEKLNPNLDPRKLQIGQEINVPDKVTNTYIIKKGDTLSAIAKKLDVSLSELTKLNSGIDPSKLQIGQTINLPDKDKVSSFDKKEKSKSIDNMSLDFHKFFDAMHQVESNGKLTGNKPILGDNGRARGPLQIWKVYFEDAKQFSDDPVVKNGKYEDVDDLDFSKRVVIQYLKRYAPNALKSKNWQVLARIHNGGPAGANKNYTKKYKNTGEYWERLKQHIK